MRIIAGEFGGRVIDSPSERTTRPTTDRVRESIFSSVYSRLPDLTDVIVLDAFAGSGALGIEALSRGAASCTFVERDRAARAVLEKNLSSAVISFMSFMASTMQSVSPAPTVAPSATKGSASGDGAA